MLFTSLVVLMAATIGLASPVPTGPDPNQVTIVGVTYAGSGCPAGSVAHTSSNDKTVLTLLYSDYVAAIGPGTLVTDRRKNCQVTLDVHYPGGWQYSIFTSDYRGYEALDAGVTGEQVATYYFSGQQQQATVSTKWVGPKSGDYLLTDVFGVESVVWSPCGKTLPLNVNSQIRLTSTSSSASGLLTTDSTDFKFSQVFHVQWRQCH